VSEPPRGFEARTALCGRIRMATEHAAFAVARLNTTCMSARCTRVVIRKLRGHGCSGKAMGCCASTPATVRAPVSPWRVLRRVRAAIGWAAYSAGVCARAVNGAHSRGSVTPPEHTAAPWWERTLRE